MKYFVKDLIIIYIDGNVERVNVYKKYLNGKISLNCDRVWYDKRTGFNPMYNYDLLKPHYNLANSNVEQILFTEYILF